MTFGPEELFRSTIYWVLDFCALLGFQRALISSFVKWEHESRILRLLGVMLLDVPESTPVKKLLSRNVSNISFIP